MASTANGTGVVKTKSGPIISADDFYDERSGKMRTYFSDTLSQRAENTERVMMLVREASYDLNKTIMRQSSTLQREGSSTIGREPSANMSKAIAAIQRAGSALLAKSGSNYGTMEETANLEAETAALMADVPSVEPPIFIDPESKNLVSEGLSSLLAEELLKKFGRNELEDKSDPKWLIFLRQLWQPMPCMIWLAAIIEASIKSWPDMSILLAIQFLNASLSFYETTKAGDAVAALKNSLKPLADVKRDGVWQRIDAALLVPGDLVKLASGAAVPADCYVTEGTIDVDQSALNGESLAVTMNKGDKPLMGSMVVRGEGEGTVEATGKDTFLGRAAALMNTGGDEMSNLDKLLIKVMSILVVISMLLCTIAFVYLLRSGQDLKEALSFTVVLLVASIPVAIEIVCTTTLALGSRELAKAGAIVSRLAAIEDMAGMSVLCSDKTGTLTLNQMVIQEETPLYAKGETQYSVLRYAAMAAKWKEPPRDALDTLVLTAVDLPSLNDVVQTDFMPFDPSVKRTEGTVKLKTGETFKTTKGAPNIILKLVEDEAIKKQVETDVEKLGARGIRSLAVAKTDTSGMWRMLGLLTFLDPPRPDSKVTIGKANGYGVEVKMITGDHLLIAKETCRQLGLSDNIYGPEELPKLGADNEMPANLMDYLPMIENASGFAQVYPEHKFMAVEVLRKGGFKTGMTGDGVNDAAALKRADVGIAVMGATDAANAAADIVLTKPGLSAIITGMVVARVVFGRMTSFITYRIAATLQLLVFFFIAVLTMHPESYRPAELVQEVWPAFFGMPVLMLMLITLLNDGTLISIGYDNVNPSPMPEKWNLRVLFFISAVLGGVACISSLFLLHICLDSWNPVGFWATYLRLPGLEYGQITAIIYLKVSVSDFLTLFSARARDNYFWNNKPSPILLIAGGIACTISTIVANFWPVSNPDHIPTEGLALVAPKFMSILVWIYCLAFFFIQDAAKVLAFSLLKSYNLLGINDAAKQCRKLKDAGHMV